MECNKKDEETPKLNVDIEWKVTRSGSNFADSWGTEGILLKRSVMP